MSETRALSPLSEDDYGSIADAVMETARGRWFLGEYSKRNRTADTDMLLCAIQRLEANTGGERSSQQIERVRFDLVEMAKTIAQLKLEVTSGDEQSQFMQATEALDDVVKTTETATSSILEAAEQIQEMAWTLRESGADAAVCDALDRRAADIYTACAFQDLTAQRTQKVVRTLRYLEGRINALIDAWSSDKPMSDMDSGSAADQNGHNKNISDRNISRVDAALQSLSQDDIDVVIIDHRGDSEALWLDNQIVEQDQIEPAYDAMLEEHDIAFIDTSLQVTGQTEFCSIAIPDEPVNISVIEPEMVSPVHIVAPGNIAAQSHVSLTAIDALPTSAKLSLFG
jgi:chemotaxis regulatin CheY-phosphate phosphatase CheZ